MEHQCIVKTAKENTQQIIKNGNTGISSKEEWNYKCICTLKQKNYTNVNNTNNFPTLKNHKINENSLSNFSSVTYKQTVEKGKYLSPKKWK